jgi:hypothetical protein
MQLRPFNQGLAVLGVIVATLALSVLPTNGRADILTMTESSSKNLTVSLTVFGNTIFTNQLFQSTNGDAWGITQAELPLQFGFSDGIANSIQDVAWVEPENQSLFNLLMLRFHGSQGTSILMFSEVNSDFLRDATVGDPVAFFADGGACIANNAFADCPILQNNNSLGIPIFSGASRSTLTVTFNDLGDAPPAVPLPATWTMLLLGLTGISFLSYRRKSKLDYVFGITGLKPFATS